MRKKTTGKDHQNNCKVVYIAGAIVTIALVGAVVIGCSGGNADTQKSSVSSNSEAENPSYGELKSQYISEKRAEDKAIKEAAKLPDIKGKIELEYDSNAPEPKEDMAIVKISKLIENSSLVVDVPQSCRDAVQPNLSSQFKFINEIFGSYRDSFNVIPVNIAKDEFLGAAKIHVKDNSTNSIYYIICKSKFIYNDKTPDDSKIESLDISSPVDAGMES